MSPRIRDYLTLFSTHNDRPVSSTQHPNKAKQTMKFPGPDQGFAHLLLYSGRPRAHIQQNCSVSIMEQMVIEMSWKALKREQHMLRNSGGCNRRIYSPEQPRVSDRRRCIVASSAAAQQQGRCQPPDPLIQLSTQPPAPQPLHIQPKRSEIATHNSFYFLVAFKGFFLPDFTRFSSITPEPAITFSWIFREHWTNGSVKNSAA